MRVGVVGSGELAVACALALRANRAVDCAEARHVTLFSRDPHTAVCAATTAHTDPAAPATVFSAFTTAQIPVPTERFSLARLPKMATDEGANPQGEPASSVMPALDQLFFCAPLESLVARRNNERKRVSGEQDGAAEMAAMQQFASTAASHAAASGPRFSAVFTRGLTEDGTTPAELLTPVLDGVVPLFVASGPIFSKEWAMQCAPLTGVAARLSSPTSIPPRPSAGGCVEPTPSQASPSQGAAGESLGRFSGTSLCFALSLTSPVDEGLAEAIREKLIHSCFPRENVTVLLDRESAAVLSLSNACTLLCAFGGGLVSNAFTGANVSALASYTQHAQRAVRDLVNGVLKRAADTPLPLEVHATIAMSCTNFSSREFALGRKMDFHFRHDDALNAVYGAHSSFELMQTADGIHTLLKKHDVHSPFFESLLDTLNTLLRASTVGAGLVKEGFYDFRSSEPSLVLQHALQVDDAMLSGDEASFEKAKKRMQEALGPHCVF